MVEIYGVSGINETDVIQLPLEDCKARRGQTLEPASTLGDHRASWKGSLRVHRIKSDPIAQMVQTYVCRHYKGPNSTCKSKVAGSGVQAVVLWRSRRSNGHTALGGYSEPCFRFTIFLYKLD
jgi:hypothetical protein